MKCRRGGGGGGCRPLPTPAWRLLAVCLLLCFFLSPLPSSVLASAEIHHATTESEASNSPGPPAAAPDEFVRLQCYFEDERQMVLLHKTEGIADLQRKLREQFDTEENGLIVKYEEDGELFGLKSQDNLIAALRGLEHSQRRSLNLFIWPKQKAKSAPITIVLSESEHHLAVRKPDGGIPLWVPTLTSSLGFIAMIAVAIISAGAASLDALRKIGTEEELTHADWLHIFKTQSSRHLPTLTESLTYISLSCLAINMLDIDPLTFHWRTEHQLLPCLLGIAYGILVPYMLGQLANRLKTWRMKKKAQEEARILRLKASKRASGVSAQESSTTDSESENEDTLLGSNQGTKEPKGTKPDGTKSQLSKVPDLRSLLTSVTHELSYVFLTNAIYFSSCYFWTESVFVSCIGSQLLSVAAREFMEGVVTIGIAFWVYLFIAYFAYIPSFLLYLSSLAWLVIHILAPTKPRYDYTALMLLTGSLPSCLCAAAAWSTYRELEQWCSQKRQADPGSSPTHRD